MRSLLLLSSATLAAAAAAELAARFSPPASDPSARPPPGAVGSDTYGGGSSGSSTGDGKTCYFPAGNIATDNVPCNDGQAVSHCCGSKKACLANGLCRINTEADSVEYARGGCTDQSWTSPGCFQHCKDPQPGSPASTGAAVFECFSGGYFRAGTYCCENGINAKTACCATESLLFRLAPGTTRAASGDPFAGPTYASTPSVPAFLAGDDRTLPYLGPGGLGANPAATTAPAPGGPSSAVGPHPAATTITAAATTTSSAFVMQVSNGIVIGPAVTGGAATATSSDSLLGSFSPVPVATPATASSSSVVALGAAPTGVAAHAGLACGAGLVAAWNVMDWVCAA